MKSKGPVVLFTVLAVLIAGAGVVMAAGPPKPKFAPVPKEPTQGYQVQDHCAGVVVLDEPAAMVHAQGLGAQAELFDPGAQMKWVVKAAAALGVPLTCDLSAVPSPSKTFTYRLFQAYLRGARDAQPVQKITETQALGVASTLRFMLLAAGADAAEMPEGLGG